MKTILLTIPIFIIILVGFVIFFPYTMEITPTTISLSDNQNGGDCLKIGNWNPQSKTCTLTDDLTNIRNIQVNADDITLDGNNHLVVGHGDTSLLSGIEVISKSGVTIKNLQLKDFRNAVFLKNSSNNTLTNLKISQSVKNGITLVDNSNNNTISFNNIHSNIRHGISLQHSVNNFITGNDIKQTRDGIRLNNSNNTVITRNTIADSLVEGIDIHNSFDIMVYHNNLLEQDAIPILDNYPQNLNTFFISSGGNYYSVYDEPSEGCYDQNSDGFCDSPFIFGCNDKSSEEACAKKLAFQATINHNDPLPFIEKNGWDNLD